MTRGYSDLYEEVSRLHGLGEGEVDLLAEAGGALPLHHHLGGTLQAAAANSNNNNWLEVSRNISIMIGEENLSGVLPCFVILVP